MSWYDEMVAARRSKSLTTGNIRCGVAAVHEVLASLALEIPVNCHSELMEDSLGNIEPVQLGVEQMCQALVELPSITDDRVRALFLFAVNPPPTSVEAERAFSAAGLLCTKIRSCLSDVTLDTLCFLRSYYRKR